MKKSALTAVKLQTTDLPACEQFFKTVFGFEVVHRYGGGAGDSFEEIVMTLRGEGGTMLKFIQFSDPSASATGATIQIVLDDIEEAMAAAAAFGSTVQLEPTLYPEAGVRMAVITTDQGLNIELVQTP
jgi:catechol 2,3-dioxygenase-like lactoylglutathione lyase family enzyme